MNKSFTTGEASRATGVNPRTMDHWARTGFIVPSVTAATGTGSERRYSFADLVALRTARILRGMGIETKAIGPLVEGVINCISRAGHLYRREWLIATSTGVHLAFTSKEMALVIATHDYAIVVDLVRIQSDVKAEIASIPNRKKVA